MRVGRLPRRHQRHLRPRAGAGRCCHLKGYPARTKSNGVPAWGRLVATVLFAGLTLWGLALGAESQREVFLESDLEAAQQAARGAASNLIPLTAFLAAIGAAATVGLMSRRPFTRRLLPSAALAASVYLLINLAQGAWPNYNAYLEGRTASLTNSLFAANLPATPSLAIPILGAVAALLAAAVWSATRLLRDDAGSDASPLGLLRRQVCAFALSTPFLIVAIVGSLRLLVRLPADAAGVGPYLVFLPACVLVCLALLATGLAKARQLGILERNGRLIGSVQDAWQMLGRIEAVLASVLAALAFAASLLAPIAMDDLQLGRVFSVTLRGHGQLMVVLLLAFVPHLRLHRAVRQRLAHAPPHAGTLESGTHPLAVVATACALAGLAGCGLVSLADGGALWPWLVAVLPLAVLAVVAGRPRDAAPAALFACFLLWAIGNTIVATYDGNQEGVLRFETPPGVLALWRTVAVLGAAAVVFRPLRGLGAQLGMVATPLAAGVAICAGAIVLLEMPLWAWLTPRAGTDALAVGSLLASFDAPVRASIHVVCSVLAAAGAILMARLQRPDWFDKRRPRHSSPMRVKSRVSS